MRFLACFLILLCSISCFGQVEVVKKKSLVGVTRPEIIGDRIFIGEDSNPTVADSAIILIDKSWKFSQLKIKRDGLRVEPAKLSNGDLELVGKGSYLIDCTLFDPEKGIYNEEFSVTLGGDSPKPDPPKPDPKPPKPDDPVPPSDIPNEYNVGQIAFSFAPSDPEMAKQISGWYAEGAERLFGTPNLATINKIIQDIDAKFAAKQCRDVVTCQAWNDWKQKVVDALRREQIARVMFTREQWYGALNEIAAGLRAVK